MKKINAWLVVMVIYEQDVQISLYIVGNLQSVSRRATVLMNPTKKQRRIHGHQSYARVGSGQGQKRAEKCFGWTDRRTDRPNDGLTDIAGYRDVCTRLKMFDFQKHRLTENIT